MILRKITSSEKEEKTGVGNQTQDKKDDVVDCIFFIGTNRTGKSTEALRYAKSWKSNNKKGIVIAHDPQKKFRDVMDYEIRPTDEDVFTKCLKYRNALIIFDDYRILHPSNITSKSLLTLMYFRAEYKLDILFICHSPKNVLESLTYYANYYYIFYSNSKEKDWNDKIPSAELCIQASDFIDNYVQQNGGRKVVCKYPDFPYVIVDTEECRLIGQNLDPNKINKNESV